jgi:hypothetical protein
METSVKKRKLKTVEITFENQTKKRFVLQDPDRQDDGKCRRQLLKSNRNSEKKVRSPNKYCGIILMGFQIMLSVG